MLRDRKRVIGTLDERIKLHQAAGDVLERMGASGIFSRRHRITPDCHSWILARARTSPPRYLLIFERSSKSNQCWRTNLANPRQAKYDSR